MHDQLRTELESRLANEQVLQRLPSVIAALVRDDELLWCDSRGTVGVPGGGTPTADTQYRIGSITKTFIAVSVLRLRDEGVVDLSDGIGAHLSELAELPITLAQLLSHTSGLRAETPAPWWERAPGVSFSELAASTLRRQDLLWRPGRRFHYSNVGYAVLGELVSRKRAAPVFRVIEEELLQPLGMERTTTRPQMPYVEGRAVHPNADLVLVEPEHDAVSMAPAGQLWSTVEDLSRWAALLSGRRPDVLSADSLAEMTEPLGIGDMPGQAWTAGYGLGLQLWNDGGRRRYGHTGAMPGHWAMLMVDAESKDVAVGFANSTYRGFRPAFFGDLLTTLDEQMPHLPEPFIPATSVDAATLALVGTWYWGPVEYRLTLRADGLLELHSVPGGRDAAFRSAGDGTYVGEYGYFCGERLVPTRSADGTVLAFDIASFIFTRRPYDVDAEIPGGVDARGWHGGS